MSRQPKTIFLTLRELNDGEIWQSRANLMIKDDNISIGEALAIHNILHFYPGETTALKLIRSRSFYEDTIVPNVIPTCKMNPVWSLMADPDNPETGKILYVVNSKRSLDSTKHYEYYMFQTDFPR